MASSSVSFPPAYAPSVLRSGQKDRQYEEQLLQQLTDVVESVGGSRFLMHNQRRVALASQLLYYCLTTGLGRQTLGEEYCDIVQHAVGSFGRPSLLRRALLIALHIAIPIVSQQQQQQQYASSRRASVPLDSVDVRHGKSTTKSRTRALASKIRALLVKHRDTLRKNAFALHLAVFYFQGVYYHIAKRIVRVRYTSLNRYGDSALMQASYAPLGAMIVAELLVANAIKLSRLIRGPSAANEAASNAAGKDEIAAEEAYTSGGDCAFILDIGRVLSSAAQTGKGKQTVRWKWAQQPPRQAAILLPLCSVPSTDELHVLFTIRNAHMRSHAGEISFPGGKKDDTDPSLIDTARREVAEELMLELPSSAILGRLSSLPDKTFTMEVHPFVGHLDLAALYHDRHAAPSRPPPPPADSAGVILPQVMPLFSVDEVAGVFMLPLSYFTDVRNRQFRDFPVSKFRGRAVCWDVPGSTDIWFGKPATTATNNPTTTAAAATSRRGLLKARDCADISLTIWGLTSFVLNEFVETLVCPTPNGKPML
ncbi:hypothetical protein RI367_007632 [Sorochytrium milnesiophthora]